MLSLSFTDRKTARDGLLGKQLHHNTLHNFMERNQMTTIRNGYTFLSDELHHKISETSKQFPNSGCCEIISHLKTLEPPILLQSDRCQKLSSDVDPVATNCRWSQAIHRRQHHVASPNALWHIESIHALIRWVISWLLDLPNVDSYIFNFFERHTKMTHQADFNATTYAPPCSVSLHSPESFQTFFFTKTFFVLDLFLCKGASTKTFSNFFRTYVYLSPVPLSLLCFVILTHTTHTMLYSNLIVIIKRVRYLGLPGT